MKTLRFFLGIFLMPVLVSCSSGCSSRQDGGSVELPEKNEFLSNNTPVFEKQETPLVLKRGIKRVIYYAGKKGQIMTFQLSCGGLKTQTVYEWKKTESDNLRLSVSPAGKNQWKVVHQAKTQDAAQIFRQPLTFSPGNFITVTVPLTFLDDYVLKNPEGEKLDVKAELDLVSISADPLVYTISVRPGKRTKVREIIFAD